MRLHCSRSYLTLSQAQNFFEMYHLNIQFQKKKNYQIAYYPMFIFLKSQRQG